MFGLFSLIWFLNLPTVSLQSLEFSIEPKSVVVREGNPAILNCQTYRPPNDVVIQWRKGKGAAWILDYINQPYRLLNNNSLYFPSVGKDDEDSYFCGAFLLLGTQTIITKTPAYITLAYIKSNFIEPPPDTTVREHTTATLTCTSGASQPLPNVTWQKNGRPIGNMNNTAQSHLPDWNATSATLQLKNVSLADAGYYTCVAINPLLPNEPKTSQRALLLVLPKDDEPRIEVHPVNKLSPISYPLQMDCVIVGVPPPVIYWIHNGIKVLNTSNTLVYLNGSLYIKSLTLNHRGHYSCNGTNDKGSVASSTIFLGVAFIQYNFVQDPQNKTAVNGSKVELECKPPPHFPAKLSYKWYKDYRVILLDGRTNISSSGSLIFTQVLKSDEESYLCEATNAFARQIRTSRVGYLTVNVPPYFLSPPSNQTVLLNENLHLTCVFEGSPRPRVLWYHGNTLLSNSSRLYLSADGNLTLIAVRRSDDGVYKCSIKNVAGNRIAEAEVRVHAPPNGTAMPRDASVVLGTNASFSCQFGGNPQPTVRWYFSPSKIEATPLSRNSSHFIQTKGQLHILNVTEQDKGWFTCAGNNIVGSQNFSAYLNVLVSAFLIQSPRNTTVNHSDVAEMTCRGYGNPEPTITWLKDGRLVVSNNKTTFNGSNLQLKNVVRNDSGVYSCTAKNNLGNETSSAYLTVQIPPTIQSVVGPSRVQWRRNVSFQCKVDGVPKPEITWLKVSHPIVYTKRILKKGDDLFITSTGQNDTGNYTCKASNVVGFATTVKQLVVEVPPYRPLNVHITNITSTSIQVLWKSSFDGFSHIISFRLEMRTDSQSWKNISDSITSENFTIRNLRPYTRYHVRVFARNKIGWSEASENTNIITSQDFPSSPVGLRCRGYNASAVRLAWDKPSHPNGRLGQYRVQYKKIGSLTVEENVTSLHMSRIISGLETFTVYKYRVQASTGTNSSLWGNYSSYVSCRSGEAAPAAAPQNFSLTPVGSDTILARWKVIPSRSENGIVRGYCIQYRKTSETHYTKINITGNKTLDFNVTGLVAWTEYVMQVSAVTVARGPWGEARTSRTFESEPSGPPTNILIKANSSSSFLITWRPPLLNESNGLVMGYMVLYGKEIALGLSMNITTNKTSVQLTDLLIYTSYVVQIRAFTSVGYGPFSDRKIARTFESYPGTVRNVTEAISNDSVLVTWKAPNTPNGIITAYTVHYNTTIAITVRRPGTNLTTRNITTQSQHMTTLVTRVILNGIPGNVTYFLCVAAKTSVGYGKCSNAIIFTTNFTLKTTPKPGEKPGVFTPSIVDDHLPLIAGGATIFVVIVIALFTCFMVRRRNRKKEEKQAKQTHNFRGHAFSMDSYDDGQSSMASRGSRPINGYSMESSSLQSRTNGSNIFTSEGHDKSHLVRLRNSSLNLGSDASSYDDPYSSVVEIGVDPLTVNPLYAPSPQLVTDRSQVHSAHNPLYAEVSLHGTASAGNSDSGSINSHVAVNPLYSSTTFPPNQPHHSAGASRAENAGEKHAGMPPDQVPRANLTSAVSDGCSEGSMEGNEYFSSDDEGSPPHPHEVLVLPPPPPEFSDFTGGPYEPEAHSGFSNEVTDF